MQTAIILRILGPLLMTFSLSMLPPMGVSLWYGDGEMPYFFFTLITLLSLGLVMWLPAQGRRLELDVRSSFVVVTLFWAVLGAVSGLPLHYSPTPHLSFTDAVFESVSGFTTAGSTVIVGLDNLPPSLLYYRQQLQFLGGMGIVVLAVAVMPMLGIGGMQLYKAESPGPVKDEKITPRIAQSARLLWVIYLGLTVLCAVAFWLAGMTVFDAIGHSFATISTGGFSTHDASLAYFDSPAIELIANVFMLLGAINFSIHFVAWPSLLPVLLIYISFIGGCAGSTAGGIKVVRIVLLLKQAVREIELLAHPHAMRLVKFGGRPVPEKVVGAVWGFFALYLVVTTTMTLLMMAAGLDVLSAFSAVAACLNVLGPGLGSVAANFAGLTDPGKWLLILAMLLGRLEIYTLLALLTPFFWRR